MSIFLKLTSLILAGSILLSVPQTAFCQSRAVLEHRLNELEEKFERLLILNEGQALSISEKEWQQQQMREQIQQLQWQFQELQSSQNELRQRTRKLEVENAELKRRLSEFKSLPVVGTADSRDRRSPVIQPPQVSLSYSIQGRSSNRGVYPINGGIETPLRGVPQVPRPVSYYD